MYPAQSKGFFKEIDEGQATRLLRGEHDLMLRVLDALDKTVKRLNKKQEVSLRLLDEIIEFLAIYVEAGHHLKEEETLFPLLQEGGIPIQEGPIGHLLDQHQQSRTILQNMQRSLIKLSIGDEDGRIMLCNQAASYSQLIREHIVNEDRVLFLLTDSLLKPEAQQAMRSHFLLLENSNWQNKTSQYWEQLVEDIEKQVASWQS